MAQVLRYARVRKLFFDRQPIRNKSRQGVLRRLARFGAHTMTRARRSIRRPKKEKVFGEDGAPLRDAQGKLIKRSAPSRPGEPPRNVTGVYKRSIFFGLEPGRLSTVVGGIAGESGAAETLEHGGTAVIRDRGGRRRRVKIEPRPAVRISYEKERDEQLPELFKDLF